MKPNLAVKLYFLFQCFYHFYNFTEKLANKTLKWICFKLQPQLEAKGGDIVMRNGQFGFV